MATVQQVTFSFYYDENFRLQVWKTLLRYFQRYSLSSMLPFPEIFFIQSVTILVVRLVTDHYFPNLLNTKMSISLKGKKDTPKRKTPFFWIFKSFSNAAIIFLVIGTSSLVGRTKMLHSLAKSIITPAKGKSKERQRIWTSNLLIWAKFLKLHP